MSHLTIRVRLTALYGVLFLIGGTILLGVTYLLLSQKLESRGSAKVATVFDATKNTDLDKIMVRLDGEQITVAELRNEFVRQQREYRRDMLNSLLTQGSIALGLVTVVGIGFGWLMSERALRPVHQITETARRVAAGSLHERIALTGPNDEIKELADTFDSMLERLDSAFDGQRRFVANASHELRTPLTINRTLIEVALGRSLVPETTRQLGETLLAVNERHERLIDGLLTLVRSEQAVTVRDPIDLADVARHVGHGRAVLDLAPAPTAGDPVLLERVLQNLLDNAVTYNVPDGKVWIDTRAIGDKVKVTVENTGPTVPPYEIPALFEPFRRLRSRTGSASGTGLGLSIVRAVTHAHGGTVDAVARPEGGLEVIVTLPAHLPPDPPGTQQSRSVTRPKRQPRRHQHAAP
jgi:signal transduction histidine kinase